MKKKVTIGCAAAIVVGLSIVCGICFGGFSNVKAKLVDSNNTPVDCNIGPGPQDVEEGYSFEAGGEEIDYSAPLDM